MVQIPISLLNMNRMIIIAIIRKNHNFSSLLKTDLCFLDINDSGKCTFNNDLNKSFIVLKNYFKNDLTYRTVKESRC